MYRAYIYAKFERYEHNVLLRNLLCLFFYGTKKDSLRISRGNSPLMLASQKKMGALINVALITSHLFVVFKECNASPSNTTTQAQGDIFLLPVNCVRDRQISCQTYRIYRVSQKKGD